MPETSLYNSDRHLPYCPTTWEEGQVRETIVDILRRTGEGWDRTERLWPIHPKDEHEGESRFSTTFYFGAAGVLWAVRELSDFAPIERDLPTIDDVLARHLECEARSRSSSNGAFTLAGWRQ